MTLEFILAFSFLVIFVVSIALYIANIYIEIRKFMLELDKDVSAEITEELKKRKKFDPGNYIKNNRN